MTIQSSYQPITYAGTGITSSFATGFAFQTAAQILVTTQNTSTLVITVLVLGVDYTVTGGGLPATNGTVVTTIPVPSGTNITIARNIALAQGTTWQTNDAYPANFYRVENALDLLTMAFQGSVYSGGRVLTLRPQDIDGAGWYDAKFNGIRNLAPGILGNDGTTVAQVEQFVANIIATGGLVAPGSFNYTGDGTTTAFSIVGATISAPSAYSVVVGGAVQRDFLDYTINLNTNPPTIVFTSAPPLGATIYIRQLGFMLPMSATGGLDASIITTGIVNPLRLGSGGPSADTFLNGLSQWTNTLVGPSGTASPPADIVSLFTAQQAANAGIRVFAGAGSQASLRFGTATSGNPWDVQFVYDPTIGAIGWQPFGQPIMGEFYNTGDVQFGNAGLYFARLNNRVGINNAAPQYTLDVSGTVNAIKYLGAADASLIQTGVINPLRLGSNMPAPGTFLRSDSVWAIPPSTGGGGSATNTSGTFTVAAVGSTQVIPVVSATGFANNQFVYVSDGTHTIYGQITSGGISGLNITVTTTVRSPAALLATRWRQVRRSLRQCHRRD